MENYNDCRVLFTSSKPGSRDSGGADGLWKSRKRHRMVFSHQIHSRLEEGQAEEFVKTITNLLIRDPKKNLNPEDVPVTELHRARSKRVKLPDNLSEYYDGKKYIESDSLGFETEEAISHLNGLSEMIEVEKIFTCMHSIFVAFTVSKEDIHKSCQKLKGWTEVIIGANKKKEKFLNDLELEALARKEISKIYPK